MCNLDVSDFKNTSMFQLNKDKVPKKNGDGNHTEIIKLNNSITYEYAKNEFLKVAGDRLILDTASQQTLCENTQVDCLDIEKEKTKQIEAQELTKQVEVQETTKREQIQSDKEIRLAEIELEKLRIQQLTSTNQQDEPVQEIPREPIQTPQIIQEENIELVKKFITIKTQFSQNRKDYIFIEQLFVRFIEWFHSIYPNTASPLSQTQMSRCIARLPEFIVMRIAIGPRFNNATPRKVGLVNRKWLN